MCDQYETIYFKPVTAANFIKLNFKIGDDMNKEIFDSPMKKNPNGFYNYAEEKTMNDSEEINPFLKAIVIRNIRSKLSHKELFTVYDITDAIKTEFSDPTITNIYDVDRILYPFVLEERYKYNYNLTTCFLKNGKRTIIYYPEDATPDDYIHFKSSCSDSIEDDDDDVVGSLLGVAEELAESVDNFFKGEITLPDLKEAYGLYITNVDILNSKIED